MKKKAYSDLNSEHNCVTVPLFFTPRAQAAQAKIQLANPVNIINTTKITKYGIECESKERDDIIAKLDKSVGF